MIYLAFNALYKLTSYKRECGIFIVFRKRFIIKNNISQALNTLFSTALLRHFFGISSTNTEEMPKKRHLNDDKTSDLQSLQTHLDNFFDGHRTSVGIDPVGRGEQFLNGRFGKAEHLQRSHGLVASLCV